MNSGDILSTYVVGAMISILVQGFSLEDIRDYRVIFWPISLVKYLLSSLYKAIVD
jgi:hypothetical protein